MSEPITREEMKAAMEVQSKNTEQMLAVVKSLERIIDTQNHISELQEKLVEKMTNGIKHEIAHEVITELNMACEPFMRDIKSSVSLLHDRTPIINRMAADIDKVKWFVGTVGLVIVIATVILRGIDNRAIYINQEENIKRSQIMLQEIQKHIEDSKPKEIHNETR